MKHSYCYIGSKGDKSDFHNDFSNLLCVKEVLTIILPFFRIILRSFSRLTFANISIIKSGPSPLVAS